MLVLVWLIKICNNKILQYTISVLSSLELQQTDRASLFGAVMMRKAEIFLKLSKLAFSARLKDTSSLNP